MINLKLIRNLCVSPSGGHKAVGIEKRRVQMLRVIFGCSQVKWQGNKSCHHQDHGKYLQIMFVNFKLHKHLVEGILQL